MHNLSVLALTSALTLLAGACANPNYQSDPNVVACNVGGPLGHRELIIASAPNPQAVPGRPPDCRMGPDGVMRRSPAAMTGGPDRR